MTERPAHPPEPPPPEPSDGAARDSDPEGFRDARVARLAEEFLKYADEVERRLRGRHASPNAHLQDAATSILANIGEALDEPSMGDKGRFFRYALRSAGESERILRGLRRLEALPLSMSDEGLRRLKDIKLDLHRLIRWAARQSRTDTG